MVGRISGTGSYIPKEVWDNQVLTQLVDTSDEWIQERTGVARRHIAGKNETTAYMAAEAAKRALEDANVSAQEIDLILVATISPGRIMPSTSCEVQAMIEAKRATCFDLNAACSGFVSAFVTARTYLESKIVRYALVIGSEVLSNVVDWQDRGSCILFGDGAGAVILEASKNDSWVPVLHADGRQSQALTLKSRHDANWLFEKEHPDLFKRDYFISMDGRAIFQFAVRKVPEVIDELLEKNNLKKEEIAYYLLHQANRRIVEAVAKRMDQPIEKFPMNLDEYGNTSSASIPILLDEMNQKKLLHDGDKIIIAGFGGGLTWGADVITWRKK